MEPSTDADPDTEPQPAMYLYGFRDPVMDRINPTLLAKFIMGSDEPIDVELGRAIRAELMAMERYRGVILDAVAKACATCLGAAFDNVAPIEHPVTDVPAAFWRGYAQGKYEAYCNAAGVLADIKVMAALAVEIGTQDEQATEEGAAMGQHR